MVGYCCEEGVPFVGCVCESAVWCAGCAEGLGLVWERGGSIGLQSLGILGRCRVS